MMLFTNQNDAGIYQKFVTRSRGQKRIDLRAALDSVVTPQEAVQMTFGELARAYLAVHYNGADMQLRKWIDLLDGCSAWDVSAEQLARAGIAMIDNGYSPSTVNRNLSQIGSVYRWAKRRLLSPPGFISPTISQHRYEEPIRRVQLSDQEVQRLIEGAASVKDRRFQVLIQFLIETGARLSEVAERLWSEVNLDTCSIEVLKNKTNKPRVLFFSQETAALMKRVWSSRNENSMLFESKRAQGKVVDFKKQWDKLSESIGRPDSMLNRRE